MALEPEFWAVLDAIGAELSLSRASLMIRIDAWRGRRPLASSCRVLALQWMGGDHSFAEENTS